MKLEVLCLIVRRDSLSANRFNFWHVNLRTLASNLSQQWA